MSLTRAATISSPSGFPAPRCALPLRPLLVWTLVCCTWFVAGRQSRAIDLDGLPAVENRAQAVNALDQARVIVQRARVDAIAARENLDAFLARHFDAQRNPPPPSQLRFAEPDERSLQLPNPKLAQLESQLEELHVYRGELLGYLTEEHPQVFDVDVRISTVEQQIASLGRGAALPAAGQSDREALDAERQWREYLEQLAQQGEQDAAEYRQLYETWQSAERAVDDALQLETAAAGRLKAIALSHSPQAEASPIAQSMAGALPGSGATAPGGFPQDALTSDVSDSQDGAAESRGLPDHSSSASSQSLALAALLIALAVAAVTAVRLARSTADPLFASADEVAAALAIPVVGIIPATAARMQRTGRGATRSRNWILPVQILVALLVFAVIAYAVQNPGGIGQLFEKPFER